MTSSFAELRGYTARDRVQGKNTIWFTSCTLIAYFLKTVQKVDAALESVTPLNALETVLMYLRCMSGKKQTFKFF